MPPVHGSPAGDATSGLGPVHANIPAQRRAPLVRRERFGRMFDHPGDADAERDGAEGARHGRGSDGAWAPRGDRDRPDAGRCTGRQPRQVRRGRLRSVRTHPGYGARRSAREGRPVTLPRGGADVAQTTTVWTVGGHPTANEQQRRHGDVMTAESWIRACFVGETRRCATRLVMGTKTKTSGGCAARINRRKGRRWRAVL